MSSSRGPRASDTARWPGCSRYASRSRAVAKVKAATWVQPFAWARSPGAATFKPTETELTNGAHTSLKPRSSASAASATSLPSIPGLNLSATTCNSPPGRRGGGEEEEGTTLLLLLLLLRSWATTGGGADVEGRGEGLLVQEDPSLSFVRSFSRVPAAASDSSVVHCGAPLKPAAMHLATAAASYTNPSLFGMMKPPEEMMSGVAVGSGKVHDVSTGSAVLDVALRRSVTLVGQCPGPWSVRVPFVPTIFTSSGVSASNPAYIVASPPPPKRRHAAPESSAPPPYGGWASRFPTTTACSISGIDDPGSSPPPPLDPNASRAGPTR
mmetsp:Transcript_53248/g.72732  ORF Transcript_53248/g.72732 Transcript_53248/m.72732 type:complete len:325 (-) Transcript_53248:128-1102(-)